MPKIEDLLNDPEIEKELEKLDFSKKKKESKDMSKELTKEDLEYLHDCLSEWIGDYNEDYEGSIYVKILDKIKRLLK